MKRVTLAIVAMTLAALIAVGGGKDGPVFAQGETPAMPILSVANGPNPGTAIFTWNVAPEATSYRVGWLAVEDYLANRENDAWRQKFAAAAVTDGSPWTVERLTPGIEYYFIVGLEHPGGVEWSAWDTLLLNADGMACPTEPPPPPTIGTGNTTTTQASHTLQFVCIHTELETCRLIREFYVPRVHERANGAISIEITSYPQLGIAARDGVDLVQDGTLDAIELYAESVRDDFPMMEIENLWGVGADNDVHMDISNAVEDDIVRILRGATGGEVIFRSVYPSELLFSRGPLPNMASYASKLIRSRYPITSDLLRGIGAEPQIVPFLDMYTALERGVVDGGVTVGFAGVDERWYEVSDYLYGPFSGSRRVAYFIVTGDKWAQLSSSQRTMLKEAGEEYEAENLRLLNERWEPHGIGFNASRGMTFSDFPADVKAKMRETAVNVVIPKWVDRVGGPGSEGVRIFNEKVGPIAGVVINADGTASETTVQYTAANIKQWPSPPPMTIDASASYTAVLNTTVGSITVELLPAEAPITVNNFVFLARQGFYDNTIFHRVIPEFVIQGGDPTGTGGGGPGYHFPDEPVRRAYSRGVMAMVNSGKDSNGSQFFLMHADYPLPPHYTIFGQTIAGLEVIDAIANAPTKPDGEGSYPVNPVMIETVEIIGP